MMQLSPDGAETESPAPALILSGRSFRVILFSFERITPRARQFSNSRTLPGRNDASMLPVREIECRLPIFHTAGRNVWQSDPPGGGYRPSDPAAGAW